MSKLLARLQGLDPIDNTGGGAGRGEPNARTLTERGRRVQAALDSVLESARGQPLPAL
jgi:hypothetical protein